jgi:methylated-DNA-[protein]-cysteine S-methyltransferase
MRTERAQPPTTVADRFDAIVLLPFGAVGIRANAEAITEISFVNGFVREKRAINTLAQRAVEQLIAYCDDSSNRIELPLAIVGTEFQRRVWSEICKIPCGAARSYGELAQRLGSTARAVGQACGDNRFPLAIPCHRVVAAAGIGGFSHSAGGAYERIKRWLIQHEAHGSFQLH